MNWKEILVIVISLQHATKNVPCQLDINFICYWLRRNLCYRVTYKLKENNIFKEENFLIKATLGMNLTGVSLCKTSVKYFFRK